MNSDVAIIIPSRLGSRRLAEKALAKIGDLTMIERVVIAAKQTPYQVYVATDSDLIAQLSQKQGAKTIITPKECSSGTERVFAAYKIGKLNHTTIVNVQGDMPFIEPDTISAVAHMCKTEQYEITTAVAKTDPVYAALPSNVKAILDVNGRALYFSRSMIPHNSNSYLCHIGIYAFKAASLVKFCALAPADLEKVENLEQLRALYHNMSIGACTVANMPISVDTQDDLAQAILLLSK